MGDSLKVFDKVLADVQKIKDEGNFLPDCTTKEGYEASKNFVLKVTTPARTALKDAHKEAKAFYLDGGRTVDSKKNELMAMLEGIQQPHQDAYKAVDAEKKRIKEEKDAAIQNGFDTLKGYAEQALGGGSEFIDGLMGECGCFDLDAGVFGKELDAITNLHEKIMCQLADAYAQALQFEDMQRKQAEAQAIIDAQREAEERQELERKNAELREKMRIEAEEEAKAENERLKLQALNAERLRVEAEKQALIDAERQRVIAHEAAVKAANDAAEAEKQRQVNEQLRIKAEAEAREADKKHRGSINSQALDCLIAGGLDEESAKLAVKLIALRKIAHVQINY